MDYYSKINMAIEYIEENIKEKVTLENTAEKVKLSPFHFHRVFSAFTGFTFMEYVRKRRLTIAMNEIKNSDKKIIETAFEYGYTTNESFSRAVYKEFGYNPSEIRKNNIETDKFEKFKLWGVRYKKEYGDKKIEFEMVMSPAMNIAGIKRKFSLNDGENYIEIPKIKEELLKNRNEIKDEKYPKINRQIGIAFTGPLDLTNPFINEINYFRGFEVENREQTFQSFEIKEIERFFCGKFYAGESIKQHSDTLDYVYGVWLEENRFELGDKGIEFMEEIIEYPDGKKEFYFYIPVKKD